MSVVRDYGKVDRNNWSEEDVDSGEEVLLEEGPATG